MTLKTHSALVPLACLAVFGCSEGRPKTNTTPIVAVDTGPYEPCQVVLSGAKVTVPEPGVARFEVKYQFIKGKPSRFYSCDIAFPGTPARAMKRMEAWQLKSEGVIVDGLTIPKEGVEEFEIVFTEAPTGMAAYAPVSNIIKGKVQ